MLRMRTRENNSVTPRWIRTTVNVAELKVVRQLDKVVLFCLVKYNKPFRLQKP